MCISFLKISKKETYLCTNIVKYHPYPWVINMKRFIDRHLILCKFIIYYGKKRKKKVPLCLQ